MQRVQYALIVIMACAVVLPAGMVGVQATNMAVGAAPTAEGTYVLNLASGKLLSLDLPEMAVPADAVAWSPDGTKVAVAAHSAAAVGGSMRIIAPATGTATEVMTPLGQGGGLLHWSPDGTHLAFAASGDQSLIVVGGDGTKAHAILPSGVIDLVWTPDGRGLTAIQIQFDSRNEVYTRIVTLDPETGAVIATPLADQTGSCQIGLAWSPDGAYLAYSGTGFHEGCENSDAIGIWSWEATTGTTRHLFAGGTASGNPLWMPDSAVLDEVANTRDPRFTIALRRYQPNGIGDETMVEGLPNTFPQPAPAFETANGVVAFARADCTSASSWVIPPGAPPRRLSDASVFAYNPHLSPDGMTVAWVVVRAGGSDLALASVNGSGVRTVLGGSLGLSLSGWSPDGTSLAFSATADHREDCAA